MKNNIVSQDLLIREMGANELIEYASSLKSVPNNQKFLKKCIICYYQLTKKNLLNELNKQNG